MMRSMNLGNDLLCGDGDWPSGTGVVFQTLHATVEFSSPLLQQAIWRGILPSCAHHVFVDLIKTEVADDRTMADIVHIIRKQLCSMFNYI